VPWAAAASRVSSVCSRRVFLQFQELADAARFSPSEVPAIESLNARFRQATRRRGLPDEPAALKVFYLVIVTPQKTGPT